MDFNFSVNALFKEKIVKVKNNLLPENHQFDKRGDGDVVAKISTVLDKMGVVSAKAQNLPVAITSATKLRNSDHSVYILTDPEGNRGHGSVVGILKVGRKKLFVYDLCGTQWEMEPLCILDFYVHESKQRMGCGRLLFDFMLKDQQVVPHHLALDQPSESFLMFMCKHFALDSIIPQINSFVVYEKFFDGRSDKGRGSSTNGSSGSQSKKAIRNPVQCVKATSRSGDSTPLPSYGRHSAKKAGSTMAEYMQDPSMMAENGNRLGSLPTNNHPTPTKTDVPKPVDSSEANGYDIQMRPSSLAVNGPSSAPAKADFFSKSSISEADKPDGAGDGSSQNGTAAGTPEEVPGKLDLKFHHTHLCNTDFWTYSQHSVPLAQYGHYWSSVGGLLSEDDSFETDGAAGFRNGESLKQQGRKVSNIPIGDNSEEDELSEMISLPVEDQNNHLFNVGTSGVRDVRIKKTMFQNLSPFRN